MSYIIICHCEKCHYLWAVKEKLYLPVICPNCKTKYWDKEEHPDYKNPREEINAQQSNA